MNEFEFDVPVTNISVETSDNNLNVVNKVNAETKTNSNNVVTRTDSGTIIIDEMQAVAKEPLTIVDDSNANDEVLKEKAIVFDDLTSKEPLVTDVEAKSSNKKTETTNNLEKTKAKQYVVVLDGKKDANIKDAENIIDLDEAETENVIVLDGNREDSDSVIVLDENTTYSESTIIVDDDINKITEKLPKPDVIIDLENDIVQSNSTIKLKKIKTQYNELYKENSLLTQLIEKCLDMENTDGMTRVINRTLLGIYKNVDEVYKKSEAFKKVLIRTLMQLDFEPEMKFSHLKNFCDELKKHKTKKRVPFITLEDKEQSTSCTPTKRRRVDTVIDLDDDVRIDVPQQSSTTITQRKPVCPIETVYPPIEIDDDDSSSDVFINDDDSTSFAHDNSNKENSRKHKKSKKHKRKRGRPRNIDLLDKDSDRNQYDVSSGIVISKIMSCVDLDNNRISESLEPRNSISEPEQLLEPRLDVDRNSISEPERLLEPRLALEVNMTEFNQTRIKNMESYLANLKKQLKALDEAEVTTDCPMSPYILSEQIKKRIVSAYKELCELTGTEVTKRHEVRLQVVPGHPEGPVRCLEEFLNSNIDEAGNPPFPDMHDVVQCVCDANTRYNMHWSRTQIMSEAHALFTQFGRSMQKRRQKREWKDLMSLVKQEAPDPADDDPALQARLIENSLIAKRNEDELLDRYTKMEHGLIPQLEPEMMLSMHQSEESDQESDVDAPVTCNTDNNPPNIEISADLTKLVDVITSPDSGKKKLETTGCGSTLSVTCGNIVIQPIVNYSNPIQSSSNGIKATSSNTEIMLFSSKTKNVSKPLGSTNHDLTNEKVVSMEKIQEDIGSNNNFIETINLTKESSINNKFDLTNAAKIAKEILCMVQSDLSAENGETKEKNIRHCEAFKMFSATVKFTDLNLNGFAKNQDVCATKSIANIPNSSINNLECKENGRTTDSYEILTHTNRYKSIVINTKSNNDNIEIACKELETPCVNVVGKETKLIASPKDSTDTIGNVKDIVKPEPLDIPSMLEELGQSFTTIIFDIEDPFLVIEISDSSESEDEDI